MILGRLKKNLRIELELILASGKSERIVKKLKDKVKRIRTKNRMKNKTKIKKY